MAAASHDMIEKVHVMLVNHDKEFDTEMVDLLKSYDYKVTTVGMTSATISMLFKEREKIDVLIINVPSPNQLSFQLLDQVAALNIISLFVCDEHNDHLAKKALDMGAYLCLKKPLDEAIVKYLWQFTLREKIQREKVKRRLEENKVQMNMGDIGNNNIIRDSEERNEDKNNVPNNSKKRRIINKGKNDVISKRKYKLRRKRDKRTIEEIEEEEEESQSKSSNKRSKRKPCKKWTKELHAKFMEAVQQLGEGGCYPENIREVMNVPNLTRMQVASHLQKCRSNNWRAPEERKYVRHPLCHGSSNGSQQINRFRKFGTMPRLPTSISSLQSNPDPIQRDVESPFLSLNTNVFARGESSTQQQFYHPVLQAQSRNLSIENSLKNLFLSAQNDVSGGIQQQHDLLFGVLGPQILQDPIVENAAHRYGLAFDREDHHTESENHRTQSEDHHSNSDYSLDLNVAYVETYSDSETISDTCIKNVTISDAYAENVAINGLGAANANFQQYVGEPTMCNPSYIAATKHVSDIEGGDSNEKNNRDAYFDFNDMNYIFQDIGPPSANLPNEYDNGEFDQVHSNEQMEVTQSVQFPGIANFPEESST